MNNFELNKKWNKSSFIFFVNSSFLGNLSVHILIFGHRNSDAIFSAVPTGNGPLPYALLESCEYKKYA